MIHECNVHCQSMSDVQMEVLGLNESAGVWLPFVLDLDCIEGAKVTTLDEESDCFKCTTVYTKSGSMYLLDTRYREFSKIFKEYKNDTRVQS